MLNLAEALAAYPSYTRHDLTREYPKLRQCVLVEARLNVLDAVRPNVGDTGTCGIWSREGSASHFSAATNCWAIPHGRLGLAAPVAIGHHCTTVPGVLSCGPGRAGAGRGAGGRHSGSHGEVGLPKPLWFGILADGVPGPGLAVARTSATARGTHITTASR